MYKPSDQNQTFLSCLKPNTGHYQQNVNYIISDWHSCSRSSLFIRLAIIEITCDNHLSAHVVIEARNARHAGAFFFSSFFTTNIDKIPNIGEWCRTLPSTEGGLATCSCWVPSEGTYLSFTQLNNSYFNSLVANHWTKCYKITPVLHVCLFC